jgi:hypothetical protein
MEGMLDGCAVFDIMYKAIALAVCNGVGSKNDSKEGLLTGDRRRF